VKSAKNGSTIPVKAAKNGSTASKTQSGTSSGDDDNPVLRHQEPPSPTEDASGSKQSLFDIVAIDIGQTRSYEVVGEGGVEVWSDRDAASSEVIDQLPKCTIFLGRAGPSVDNSGDIEWVKRIGGPGFVRIRGRSGRVDVEEVEVNYAEAIKGSCEENGVWPIANGALCEAAAEALGLPVRGRSRSRRTSTIGPIATTPSARGRCSCRALHA